MTGNLLNIASIGMVVVGAPVLGLVLGRRQQGVSGHFLRIRRAAWPLVLIACVPALHAGERSPSVLSPECVGMDAARLVAIDEVVEHAIGKESCPGAVVLVSRFGHTVWGKAYGERMVGEHAEPMSSDTVFDMASLTKVMATASSAMVLVDRGQLVLGDRIARFIPEFAQNGKQGITVEQLLRHRSGLVADNPVQDYEDGWETALDRICALEPAYEPGGRFLYSDVGYIVLGEVLRRVSGEPLDEFARVNLFEPLGMEATSFRPGDLARARTAPTELRDGRWIRGEVHDPRAYLIGGVAGHAGLFSTARDTARFAHVILGRGELDGTRVLSASAVRAMTEPGDTPPGQARGLGWDIDTPYSSPRGDLFPMGGFGHAGFTGTSLWIEPASQTVVILLTNRVHPNGKGNVIELRREVATIVAASIINPPWPNRQAPESPVPHSAVLCGIDVLAEQKFRPVVGRRVGLITNHTGVDREGRSTIDLLHEAEGVQLVALFSPEHGIRGTLDSPVSDSRDDKTGLPVYSLYGKIRKPQREQLRDIDTLVFDIQDIGCRFYTYSATLGLAMEAAAENGIRFIVLDRANPIGGAVVEGPVLDSGREGFTGYHRIALRHGMTLGELARLYNAERKIGCDLDVVRVQGWQRADHFDATGLTWINPSPNIRSPRQAELYPGIGIIEGTNLSVGRGTDTPFELVGAPWLDGRRLASGLTSERLEGVVFVPVRFTPASSVYQSKPCGGVQIIVTERARFRSVRTGLAVARQLRLVYPETWSVDKLLGLLGNRATFDALKAGQTLDQIEAAYRDGLTEFERVRVNYLLYGRD